jgi:hypothetical protein
MSIIFEDARISMSHFYARSIEMTSSVEITAHLITHVNSPTAHDVLSNVRLLSSAMASVQVGPPLLWTAGTIWPPVCLGIVLGRFAMRRSQRARYGPDDWVVIPALV